MTKDDIALFHQAAQLIEVDGNEGVRSAARLVGEKTATALLIAHLRRAKGSMESYPPPPGIERDVDQFLTEHGLMPAI